MSLLQQLLDNNEVYLYADYRSGSLRDISGNQTPTNDGCVLKNKKAMFNFNTTCAYGVIPVGTNDFSIIVKQKPYQYNALAIHSNTTGGATTFNVTNYSSGGLSLFFDAAYYNVTGTKADIGKDNIMGWTCNRDGNVRVFYNSLFVGLRDISAKSAIDLQINCEINYKTSTRRSDYDYVLIVKRVLTDAEMAQLTAELENKKWTSKTKSRANAKNILVDGDMKALGTSAWSSSGSPILTKVDNVKRWLRVTNTGNNGQAIQRVLVSGKTYRVTGYGRGDGTARPRIYLGNGIYVFIGATGTDIQYINTTFTAQDNYFSLMSYGASGYCDFANIQISEVGNDEVFYKTENGIRADQKTYSTARQPVDSTDLILRSGSVKIVDGVYNGEKVKILESTSTSNCSIPRNRLKQTPNESAYGEWEFIMSAPDAKFNIIKFISSTKDTASTSGDNYNISMRPSAGSNIIQIRVTNSNLVQWESYFTGDQFYKIKVTRTGAGLFSLFIDDVLIGTATNTTYTSSNYLVFAMETGSKIILSSEKGTYGIIKK